MTGPYRTILADPPWHETGGGRIKRGADRHYPLMRTPEIIDYLRAVPAADNAHLWLWATNNHLPDALRVIETLGFRYVTNACWVKQRIGLGQYLRGQHELLLFAVRGKLPYKEPRPHLPSVIMADRTEHSRKPDRAYEYVEALSFPPYVEAFARRQREGWDALGNEVQQMLPCLA